MAIQGCQRLFRSLKQNQARDIFVGGAVDDASDQTYIFTNKPAFHKSCLVIVDEFWESSLDSICD